MTNLTVVGAQWGDEGKGKVVDLYTESADVVVRYGGGNNAGHTLVVEGRKVVLHLIPSGVVRGGRVCILGDGMVVDPAALLDELDQLAQAGLAVDAGAVLVSSRAHVVLPYHRVLDELRERGARPIGTTRRGVGPAYEDKVARRGLRVADLLHPARRRERLSFALDEANARIVRQGGEPLELESVWSALSEQAARLAPSIADTVSYLRRAMEAGRSVLFEGAQGVLLDVDHGSYPFVTSSTTLAGGACAGAGVGPRRLGAVVGVAKAYVTRVGRGPFPTELPEPEGSSLRQRGAEFGATTGRPRRCGWLDLPALRHAAWVSGLDYLALTKLDVLSGIDPLEVCVAYTLRGERLDTLPADPEDLGQVQPVYQRLPGFSGDLSAARSYEELPEAAREYLELASREVGVPICLVSVGPGRDQTIFRADAFRVR